MIEARVHAELKRRGGWVSMKAVMLSLGFAGTSISDALTRLKRRGAVEKQGDRITSMWRALDCELVDRRQFNGRHFATSKARQNA